jgi:SAM-dependent methyltransferase
VSDSFSFEGFDIPLDLAILTGGGAETWDGISAAHLAAYARYCPLAAGHDVLEVGCGVGRDAIPLARVLGEGGSYVGVDVSGPSIAWCREHITARHPNFGFAHLDIRSEFYNPQGSQAGHEISLPVASSSIDRIILQSVFTHMFEPDITHFLREFRRVLRRHGRVFASFFVLDEESMGLAAETPARAVAGSTTSGTPRRPWGTPPKRSPAWCAAVASPSTNRSTSDHGAAARASRTGRTSSSSGRRASSPPCADAPRPLRRRDIRVP